MTSHSGYIHHGIHVGHGWVVHYTSLTAFRRSEPAGEMSLTRFALERPACIMVHPRHPRSAENVVRRARSCLGENDYRLFTNSCEHFNNWCLAGVTHCAQLERWFRLPLRLIREPRRAPRLGPIFHWSAQRTKHHVAIN